MVRLPCISDNARLPFVINDVGKVLENHVIRRIQSKTMKECEDECYDEFKCKSINWSPDKTCELNSEIKQTKPGNYVARVGWIYRSTDYETKYVIN